MPETRVYRQRSQRGARSMRAKGAPRTHANRGVFAPGERQPVGPAGSRRPGSRENRPATIETPTDAPRRPASDAAERDFDRGRARGTLGGEVGGHVREHIHRTRRRHAITQITPAPGVLIDTPAFARRIFGAPSCFAARCWRSARPLAARRPAPRTGPPHDCKRISSPTPTRKPVRRAPERDLLGRPPDHVPARRRDCRDQRQAAADQHDVFRRRRSNGGASRDRELAGRPPR